MEFQDYINNIEYNYSYPSILKMKAKDKFLSNMLVLSIDININTCRLFVDDLEIFSIPSDIFKKIKHIFNINNSFSISDTVPIDMVDICIFSTINNSSTLDYSNKCTTLQTIFRSYDETQANYFRIPALYTLDSGTLVASIDARYGGTHDSPSKINIAFSKSVNNGISWSKATLPLQFIDYKNEIIDWDKHQPIKDMQISGSASFIDSVLLQDSHTKRLFLFADAMPFGIGSFNAQNESGFKEINNKKYLKLHHIDDEKDMYNYSIRDDSCIYNDTTNEKTLYTIDNNYNLIKENTPIYQKQYCVKFIDNNVVEEKTDIDVQTNVFYKDCPFQLFPTNYIALKYSDDEGDSWSNMHILNLDLNTNTKNPIFAPARGIQLAKGKYKNRLLLNAYFAPIGKFCNIISDNNGKTFTYTEINIEQDIVFSEAQTVELENGNIFTFSRTNKGKVGYIISTNSGDTFSKVAFVPHINVTSYGTQLSVIKFSKLIDNKEAIILSTPTDINARKNGKIFIGLLDDDNITIDWKYVYSIDLPFYSFSYSCLSELENGDIALFYEKYDSWSREELHLKNILNLEIFTIAQLCENAIS